MHDSRLQERSRQTGNEKKQLVESLGKHPNHLDFESGTDVGAVVAYSDWQKELQVGLLL